MHKSVHAFYWKEAMVRRGHAILQERQMEDSSLESPAACITTGKMNGEQQWTAENSKNRLLLEAKSRVVLVPDKQLRHVGAQKALEVRVCSGLNSQTGDLGWEPVCWVLGPSTTQVLGTLSKPGSLWEGHSSTFGSWRSLEPMWLWGEAL